MDKLDQERIIDAIDYMAEEVHNNAVRKGFWPDDKSRNDGEAIALMHSELSEALEALRHGDPDDPHCPGFSNTEIELADCVIRIMDFCAARGYGLGAAIVAKHNYNTTRPHKHGKGF